MKLMKLKLLTGALIAGSFVWSASAIVIGPLEYFTFEADAAGTAFGPNWANSGSLGSVWNFGGPATMAANGSGQMVISGHSGQTFRKLPKAGTANAAGGADQYAAPFTTGAYRLELDFNSWSLNGAAAVGGQVDLQLRPFAGSGSVVGIRLKLQDASTARVQMYSDLSAGGFQNGFRNFDFALSELTAQSFAIAFDFDNDTVDYYHNGSVTNSFSDFSASQIGTMQFSSNSSWDPGHTVSIEQLGLVAIPEPATMGLLGAFGGAILFLRRRFVK
jgi:hypothetical protein